jgi:hypothetical protein
MRQPDKFARRVSSLRQSFPESESHFIWMAGGGIKSGTSYGETDDFCYNVAKDPVHVHDFQATLLHLLGIDHTRLTFRFQGRYFRLTDVFGTVVKGVLA